VFQKRLAATVLATTRTSGSRLWWQRGQVEGRGRELVGEDDLSGMAYLRAVTKETLRLWPSTMPLLAPHFSMASYNIIIDGLVVPTGGVGPNQCLAIGLEVATLLI